MNDLKFKFTDNDDIKKTAENIHRINTEANLDGIYYDCIQIRSNCSKERKDALMAAIKACDGGVTSSICEIVSSFY